MIFMLQRYRLYVIWILFLLAPLTAWSQRAEGVVTKVKDGDSFSMMAGNRKIEVRVEGIDCPEKGQPFGNMAREFTTGLILNRTVFVEIKSYDRYKRALGTVYLMDGTTLNEKLLSEGFAWHFKKYNRNKKYAALEKEARSSMKGLWADPAPIPPWEFRKIRRERPRQTAPVHQKM
jgi:micrococcal nuclease